MCSGGFTRRVTSPGRGEAARTQLDRLNTIKLVRFIEEFDPHITVCTHFMPSGIISHLQGKRPVADQPFDRGHGLRLPRDVAFADVPALLRRAGRDQGAPGGAGAARGTHHGFRDPDRPHIRGAGESGESGGVVWVESEEDHAAAFGGRAGGGTDGVDRRAFETLEARCPGHRDMRAQRGSESAGDAGGGWGRPTDSASSAIRIGCTN